MSLSGALELEVSVGPDPAAVEAALGLDESARLGERDGMRGEGRIQNGEVEQMNARIVTIVLASSVYATSVGAQDQCLELIRLSRMKTETLMSQSQFRSTLNAHCEERANARSEGASVGVYGTGDASYARAEASYGKFCSKDTDDRGSESDYQEYVEGVQPGAYAAYAACTAARAEDGVQFEMSEAPARDRLVLAVYNKTSTESTARMSWRGSAPVTCQWDGEEAGTLERIVGPLERVILECIRDSFDSPPLMEPDSVNVIRADGGRAPMLNIPWPKYDEYEDPVPSLFDIRRDLTEELEYLTQRLIALEQEPDTIFGEWQQVDYNRVYAAETDGILVVESGGTGAASFSVRTGESDNVAEMQPRIRGRAFQSSSTPVRKGHYYHVRRRGGRPGTIFAYWIPIGR